MKNWATSGAQLGIVVLLVCILLTPNELYQSDVLSKQKSYRKNQLQHRFKGWKKNLQFAPYKFCEFLQISEGVGTGEGNFARMSEICWNCLKNLIPKKKHEKHPIRNHALVGEFHIIGAISEVFHIRGMGEFWDLYGHQIRKTPLIPQKLTSETPRHQPGGGNFAHHQGEWHFAAHNLHIHRDPQWTWQLWDKKTARKNADFLFHVCWFLRSLKLVNTELLYGF